MDNSTMGEQTRTDESKQAYCDETLKALGIQKAARQAEWEFYCVNGEPGWRYPLYQGDESVSVEPRLHEKVYRWKAADSHATTQYAWIDHDPNCARYYILPDANNAIEQAHGVAYLVKGELAALTMQSAGVRNCFAFLGEATIPSPELDDVLDALYISTLILFVDKTEQGQQAAQEVADLLAISHKLPYLIQLPSEFPPEANISDLWIASGFNVDTFWERLSGLNKVSLSQNDLTADEGADYITRRRQDAEDEDEEYFCVGPYHGTFEEEGFMGLNEPLQAVAYASEFIDANPQSPKFGKKVGLTLTEIGLMAYLQVFDRSRLIRPTLKMISENTGCKREQIMLIISGMCQKGAINDFHILSDDSIEYRFDNQYSQLSQRRLNHLYELLRKHDNQ